MGMQGGWTFTALWSGDADSCSCRHFLHQRANILEPLQGKTYFSAPKVKKACLAFGIILNHPRQAGFLISGRAGDGKIPVLCVHRPHLCPFCSSHSWPLSVMRWEDWARRQLQCHPVHPHIILTYYIVIN